MPFELRIALRYLTARRKQAFISLISGISVLGVAVGVTALLVALALMTGLQGEIQARILGSTAHLSIFKQGGEPFDDYRDVLAKLRGAPSVQGAAPAVYGKGLVSSSANSAFVTLKGVLPAEERTVTDLATQVEGGQLDGLIGDGSQGPAPVLLGRDLGANLGVDVGDVVSVTSPRGRLTPLGVMPRTFKLRVAGFVKTGLYEFDSSWAYLPLAAAQRHLGESGNDEVTLIELRVTDMYAVRKVAGQVLERLGDGFTATDWIQMNGSLFSALVLEKMAISITIGLIVMVAALNIVATLVLMVMEKHQDIAILVSMGASRGAIARIFMLQGTIIGAAGTAVGAVLGVSICWVLDHYRLIQLPGDVYQVSHVPFKLMAGEASLVLVGALLTCFVATIYPARGAARLDPAEALRYE